MTDNPHPSVRSRQVSALLRKLREDCGLSAAEVAKALGMSPSKISRMETGNRGLRANTYRRRLREWALDQYGYVTTADAARLGIPSVELRKLAGRGHLNRIDRGLYRFPDTPTTSRDTVMEAVLWAGPGAALAYDAVLALHDLALANPRSLRVITPHRVRKTHSRDDVTIITKKLPVADLTSYFRIPSTTVARALLDCRDLIMPGRLLEAADQAWHDGLLLASEHATVVAELTRT